MARLADIQNEVTEVPQEFIDAETGKMLFDDIDGEVDDAWQAAMSKRNATRKAKDVDNS